ncbi:MAG: Cache 3/Cache 2 fusion domain-containing protein [Candidatus Omnitrophota bacterium]|nr:Cache 3/Cache 2 fusion domain-containing protein [Candidatus Omnitrophota bacterium]
MKIGDIDIKWQLILISILLVTLPVIMLGIMSYNSARQGILNNIIVTLKTQSSDWLVVTQAYYDLIEENKKAAGGRTRNIVTSQASGILKLINNHLRKDPTSVALKEPLLRARKYEKNMLLYGFAGREFNTYVENFDLAIKDMKKLITEASSIIGLDTKSVTAALKKYKKEMGVVKSGGRVEGAKNLVDGAVRVASDELELEFGKLADKLSEERLKELLSSTVIGETGYVYILDYKGNYVLSKERKMDRANIWYAEDSKGRFFIQDIIKKGQVLKEDKIDYDSYVWKDSGEKSARKKFVAVMHIPEKEWVVGVTIYPEDLLAKDFEDIKKEELKSLMAQQKIGKTGYVYIIDGQGEDEGRYILSKSRKDDGENVLLMKDYKGKRFIKQIIESAPNLKKDESGAMTYLWKDKDKRFPRLRAMAYVYFQPWNWIIGTSVYLDEFFEDINSIRNQIVLVCITAIMLGSTIAYFFTSAMTNTFKQLVSKMNSAAHGNLDIDMGDVKALNDKNEIGQLANAFKQMTENLRLTTFSKDYVDDIIGNMNDALLVIDSNERIKKVNNATCRLLGYTQNEILKHPLDDFFTPKFEGLKIFKNRIFQGEIISNLEIEFKSNTGNPILVSLNGALLKDSEGKDTSAILAARDIREHKKLLDDLSKTRKDLEEKIKKLEKGDKAMLFMIEDLNTISQDLRKARDKLEQKVIEVERSNKELDDFTYVVSHDLKEPLRGIAAFTGFLDDKYKSKLDGQAKHYIELIKKSADKMEVLIKDLLKLSRISRWKKPPENIELNKLLNEIKEDLFLRLKERKVDLKILKLPAIKYEKVRISQLFTNLITNAVKYNDKKNPQVEIGCEKSNDEKFKFYVKDNGKGIPEEYREKVFGLFQRLQPDDQKGTGAGLTICKKIVESHGGEIWVESETDKGSVFYFTVPKK